MKHPDQKQIPEIFIKSKRKHANENPDPNKEEPIVRTAEEWDLIAREKNKKDAEKLFERYTIDTYSEDIANKGRKILADFWSQHDPDLRDILMGEANMVEDFYYPPYDAKHMDSYNGGCHFRQILYVFSLSFLCDYLQSVADGLEPYSEQEFDRFLRTLQGWPPRVVDEYGDLKPLSKNLQIRKKYYNHAGNIDCHSILSVIFEDQGRIFNDVMHSFVLCKQYPDYAEKAKCMLVDFLAHHGFDYYDVHNMDTPFKDMAPIALDAASLTEAICTRMQDVDNKKIPEQSKSDWNRFMKSMTGMIQVV